jgi:hypothetical protein
LRRFFFGWGTAGGAIGGAAPASDGDGLKIYLLLYIWPYIIVSSFNNLARLIINSARLIGQ